MDVYIIPVLLVLLFLVTLLKKIPAYDTFVEGAKQALSLCASLFPFLVAVFLAVQLFRVSGAAAWLSAFLSPVFSLMKLSGVSFLILSMISEPLRSCQTIAL